MLRSFRRMAFPALCTVIAATALSACSTGQPGTSGPTPSPPEQSTVPNSTPSGPAAFMGPVRQVSANGISIGYRQTGSGSPLVMIMGYDGTMSLWQYQLVQQLVAAGHQVTMFDNRGVGYSTDDTSKPMTMQLMADDTAALIQALGLRRPSVVGWSMGGQIGITLAATHPDQVGALITSGSDAGSSNYVMPTKNAMKVLENPDDQALMDLLFPANQKQAAKRFVASIELFPPEEVSDATRTRQLQAEDAYARDPSVWDALPTITIPVVVQNGALDQITRPANATKVGSRIPGAEVVVTPDASHGSLFQDYEAFAQLVAETRR